MRIDIGTGLPKGGYKRVCVQKGSNELFSKLHATCLKAPVGASLLANRTRWRVTVPFASQLAPT